MKTRYRLIRRGIRGGVFYAVDTRTGQRSSLGTADEVEATRIINAKNEALRQPVLNLQIAKAYLAGADANFVQRTWAETMEEFVKTKTGSNRVRSERAVADHAFDSIRNLPLLDTRAEHFLRVLEHGSLSTNKLEGIRKGVVHTESPPWLCGWHTYLPSFSEQIFKSAAQVGTPLPHRHPLFG